MHAEHVCVQMETMTVLVYGQLRRTSPDTSLMAHHWNRWQQANVRLDAAFNSAMHALQNVPSHLELPMALVSSIAHAAAEPQPAASATSASGPTSRLPHACVPAPLESSASETLGSQAQASGNVAPRAAPAASAQHASAAADDAWADAASAGSACVRECADHAVYNDGIQLLGCSATAMSAAGYALQKLTHVSTTWAEVRNYTASVQLEPGCVFDAAQLAQLLSMHVRFGAVPVDVLGVCRLAAQQRRRDALKAPLPFLALARDCPLDIAP